MNNIKKDAEAFVAQIKSNLVCPDSEKNRITADIENSILDYIEENGVTDISEVYSQFGTPQEICAQFNAEFEPKKIQKMLNIRKTVLIGVVACVIIFAAVMIGMWIDAHSGFHGYGVMSEVSEYTISDSTTEAPINNREIIQ